jgi:hypothetical protein
VITIALGVPVAINTAVFARRVLKEYGVGDLTVMERFVGTGMVLSMAFVWATQLLSGVELVIGWPHLGPHLPRAELAFTVGVAINSIAPAFPLAMSLLRAAGMDRAGRACRRLEPLWRDLTAAVPEIVKPPVQSGNPRDSAIRLFRMTVEIRDALMHLGPYLPAEARGPAESVRDAGDYARWIAYAARARRAGAAPDYRVAASQLPLGDGEFDADLGQLLDLARVWRGPECDAPAGDRIRLRHSRFPRRQRRVAARG